MEKIKLILRGIIEKILSSDSSPVVAGISIILLGIILSLGTFLAPELTAVAIITLSVFLTGYTIFFAYAINKNLLKKSDYVETYHIPFKTLVSEQTWIIEDIEGINSKIQKRKTLQATEPISFIQEYGWGNANLPSKEDIALKNENFDIAKIERQGSKYVVVIMLDREYQVGEKIELLYEKKLLNAFPNDEEWVEVLVTSSTEKAIMKVIFPKDRPCLEATAIHRHGDYASISQVGQRKFKEETTRTGNKVLKWEIKEPVQRDLYTIEWHW